MTRAACFLLAAFVLGVSGCYGGAAPSPVASAPVLAVSESTAEAPLAVSAPGIPLTPQNTKITFVGTKPDGKHDGGFSKFAGALDVQQPLEKSKLVVEIDMDSVYTDNPKLTGHLKSPDFFEVKTHPRATFTATQITPGGEGGATHTITGDLKLHGVTKSIPLPVKLSTSADGVALTSTFKINRHDFNISYGKGKVDDLVTITVAVQAKK